MSLEIPTLSLTLTPVTGATPREAIYEGICFAKRMNIRVILPLNGLVLHVGPWSNQEIVETAYHEGLKEIFK